MIEGLFTETCFTSFDGTLSLSASHQRPDRFCNLMPGYLDTNLAFAHDLLFPRATPDRVADVVFNRRFTSGRRFLPRPWYILYRVVQFLLWTIFKRLSL